jgi:hypothetical protein
MEEDEIKSTLGRIEQLLTTRSIDVASFQRERGAVAVQLQDLNDGQRRIYDEIRRSDLRFQEHTEADRLRFDSIRDQISNVTSVQRYYAGAIALAVFLTGVTVALIGIFVRR